MALRATRLAGTRTQTPPRSGRNPIAERPSSDTPDTRHIFPAQRNRFVLKMFVPINSFSVRYRVPLHQLLALTRPA